MATNHAPASPDALLKIVEQVKEDYVAPPVLRHRGRPRIFSGQAFLLLAVVGVVLRTFKPQELCTLLTKDVTLRERLGFPRVPHRRTVERRLDATLPEAERVAVIGYYWQHGTLADISEELGRSVPAVAGLVHRGLRRLRGNLPQIESS